MPRSEVPDPNEADDAPTETSVATAGSSAGLIPCPGCGGTAFTELQVLPDLRTRTCWSCGLILGSAKRTGPAVSEFALVDHDVYLRSVGHTRRAQARSILRSLVRYVGPGASVLDVGCSFGFFLAAARGAGFRITGLEPDPEAYGYARRLLGEDVVRRGLLESGSVPPSSADIVATLDVLEHIPPDGHEAFAGIVRQTLTPGGVWVIKVPSTEGLYYKASKLLARTYPRVGGSLIRRMWQTRYQYPHLVYFSRPSLTRWLERFGFGVLSYRYLPEIPPRTVIDRLTTDGDISRGMAYLAAPAVLGVNAVEWLRRKSDSLVVFARPRS